MSDNNKTSEYEKESTEVPELREQVLSTYARLWQLETWLRCMVYVELRALKGSSWSDGVRNFENSLAADKKLSHMPTPEYEPLSYVPFSELQRLVRENWTLFSCYLPPKTIWEAKLEEVAQIRNRIAHFRRGHIDDYRRVLQFLRDIDQGFWGFCTSYNDPHPALPPLSDPVTSQFMQLDPFPYHEVSENRWARIGSADPEMAVAVTVETLRRPWAQATKDIVGVPGYLYEICLIARGGRSFDYRSFLEHTKRIHGDAVHISLHEPASLVRITVPAVLGEDTIIQIVECAAKVAQQTVSRSPMVDLENKSVQRLSEDWPEYILGPKNPLTFLGPGMPCSFFGV